MARELRSGIIFKKSVCNREFNLRDFELNLCEVPEKNLEEVHHQDLLFEYLWLIKKENRPHKNVDQTIHNVVAKQVAKIPDISTEEKKRISTRITKKMKAHKKKYDTIRKINNQDECREKLLDFFVEIQGNTYI